VQPSALILAPEVQSIPVLVAFCSWNGHFSRRVGAAQWCELGQTLLDKIPWQYGGARHHRQVR